MFADNCAHCSVSLRNKAHIMSMYDTSWICLGCKEEERKRPDYKLAEARDMEVYASKLDSLGMGPQADNVRSLAAKLRKEV